MNTDFIILICTIAGLNASLFVALSAMVIWTVSKLDGHAQRIDQLYRTIIDILKTKQQ